MAAVEIVIIPMVTANKAKFIESCGLMFCIVECLQFSKIKWLVGVLFRFRANGAMAAWHAIDDRAMGGKSRSCLRHDTPGAAVFADENQSDARGEGRGRPSGARPWAFQSSSTRSATARPRTARIRRTAG